MTNQQQLISQLQQQLQLFYRYNGEQIIKQKFERTVFAESGQPLHYYIAQIEQNIARLATLDKVEVVAYLAEQISIQFRVLLEALQRTERSAKKAETTAAQPQKIEKKQYDVFQLPAEERIHKYYEFLTRFNDRIADLEQQQQLAPREQKPLFQQQLALLQQRRQRCLAAIEQLEEYLEFKASQAKSELN
ncbi:primosomal replication protein PriC [Gallibacterium anatis]|uniref:primosomal replication protein PriC n=1 Tax=Gallibacterium anatis TaxID=750 RepID=UPI0039FD3186